MDMSELSKIIDELDKDILKIKIPKPPIPRLEIIEQQLKYYTHSQL